ncbi:putative TolB-like translocation protein signal peptide [Frankia canadensis]|uniref:Putative TolB-like translocation protein signal peptide n=1 Tax=Frankia canadensis TaxID=1836972 RepID=A0A2I2L078_9ACTN|nr:PD40 domain-containing protein [Frankia canadensis]SNQ51323.1 putative TolB-like translocation protein signal peptide [Frankia canadensis]SOU58613.1 putative TolB-like translocation protein signal peptide [Frankia canadensis]
MSVRARLAVLAAVLVVLAGVGTAAVVHASDRAARRDDQQAGGPPIHPGQVRLATGTGAPPRRLVVRSMAWGPHRDELVVAPVGDPGAARVSSGVRCLRFHAAAGTGLCLRRVPGIVGDSYQAVVLDADLHERRRVAVGGIPTRTRVSPSGRMAAWTVFVSGDSYADGTFSTRSSILDTRTGHLDTNLETYRIVRDGRAFRAPDVNVWGVTFADDDHFFATLATGGQTYLVRGEVAARTLTTLRGNVECPSLSPDGTRLAFKKRVPGLPKDAPWRLSVLDLRTMRETPLAEGRDVDDQALWLDDRTIAYALPGDYGTDLWSAPAAGTGTPRLLATAALAGAVLG